MNNLPELEPGSSAWWEAEIENIRDLYREHPRQGDAAEAKAARSYLGSRFRRKSIEMDSGGDKLMALPHRLAEIFRANRLASKANVEFESRQQMDEFLPTLARMIIDQAD